jgi:hypothetical protein
MKTSLAFLFCALLFLGTASPVGAQTNGETFLLDVSGYGGWGIASLNSYNGTPLIEGLDTSSVPTCIETNAMYLFPAGVFSAGFRWDMISATYITGFGKDALGVQHDQDIFESNVDGIAAYTRISWLFPYVFAGITATYYAVFDPLHMASAASEFCLGVRAGAGALFIPLSFDVGGGTTLRLMAGPEVMAGMLFPVDLLYSYLRVHARINVQIAFAS